MHLGMSGKLQVLPHFVEPGKHDHFDLVLTNKKVLRFNDPRRFGAILWGEGNPEQHKLLCDLGPEPLEKSFIAEYLYKKSRKRSMPIKTFIMNSKVVVGVGNIYANEALFISGIRPTAEAGSISFERMEKLVAAIKKVLRAAIKQGGTTLKDFYGVNGQQGYFALKLKVYGRGGEACVNCLASLQEIRLGGRATVFCGSCQKD
jgi:formamidopyrimidine-DNA glycosylase